MSVNGGVGCSWQQQLPPKADVTKSLNPLLENITDYLIEEVSAEEEELLAGLAANDAATATGTHNQGSTTGETRQSSRDSSLASSGATASATPYILQLMSQLYHL